MTEEERKETVRISLHGALNRDAALELVAGIHRLAERKDTSPTAQYGWRLGAEFDLWRQIMGEERWKTTDLAEHWELADLALLATRAGGWWVYDDKVKSEVFVGMDRWLDIYATVSEVSR